MDVDIQNALHDALWEPLLQVVDYLTAEAAEDEVGQVLAAQQAADGENRLLLQALLLFCSELTDSVVPLRGVNRLGVLNSMAGDIVFRRYCADVGGSRYQTKEMGLNPAADAQPAAPHESPAAERPRDMPPLPVLLCPATMNRSPAGS